MSERTFRDAARHVDEPPSSVPPSVTESGVVCIAERPSWEIVHEYLRTRRHAARVEAFARRDPAFAEVLRWMANDLEADDDAPPSSSNLRHLRPHGRQTSGLDRPGRA